MSQPSADRTTWSEESTNVGDRAQSWPGHGHGRAMAWSWPCHYQWPTVAQRWANGGGLGVYIEKIGEFNIKRYFFLICLRELRYGPLNRIKILPGCSLRFSIIENLIPRTFFWVIFGVHPLPPPIPPPLLAEASGRPEPEKVEHVSAKMQNIPEHVNFTVCFRG